MEAEKSYNLPSGRWRTQKTSGAILVWDQSPEQWEPVVWIMVQGQEKTDVPFQAGKQESKGKKSSLFYLFFYSSPQQNRGQDDAHPYWGGESSISNANLTYIKIISQVPLSYWLEWWRNWSTEELIICPRCTIVKPVF